MKYLKLFENHNIESICNKYGITNYTLNSDGSIDVMGNVDLAGMGLTKLPIKFHNISGHFYCYNNKLTSLEFSPKSVGGSFWCNNNKITSLEGVPQSVGGDFSCSNNKITSLEFSPKLIGGVFHCVNNKLTSLESSPKYIGGYFDCLDNPLYNVWKLISPNNKWDSSIIELFNDYDCIRDGDIIMVRFNDFLIDIGKDPVDKVDGYNNI